MGINKKHPQNCECFRWLREPDLNRQHIRLRFPENPSGAMLLSSDFPTAAPLKTRFISHSERSLSKQVIRPRAHLPQVRIKKHPQNCECFRWLREPDLNRRPSGYEPDELPSCSIPRYEIFECLFIISL